MYTPKVIPYLAEALQVEDISSEVQSSSEMILAWNERLVRKTKDIDALIEPRRILARKLVEVGAKFSSSLDDGHNVNAAVSTFETLAKDLDVHGKYKRLINYVCVDNVFLNSS